MSAGRSFEDNMNEATAQLAPFAAAPLAHLIAGEHRPSFDGSTFENTSAVDGAFLGDVASGNAADIAAAASAAADASAGWAATPGTARRRVLHDVADLIAERARRIALVECVDTGQTMRFMNAAALRGAENFRFFADQAPSMADGLSLPSADHLNYTTRHPLGPVRVWLYSLAIAILAMVAIGGLTRLTDSGLSITSWKPISGIIPPLSNADWLAEFNAYKLIPEFKLQNSWMDLAAFKSIFWWEWGHRLRQ